MQNSSQSKLTSCAIRANLSAIPAPFICCMYAAMRTLPKPRPWNAGRIATEWSTIVRPSSWWPTFVRGGLVASHPSGTPMDASEAVVSCVLAAMTWPMRTLIAPFLRLVSTGCPVARVSILGSEPGIMVQKIPKHSSPHLVSLYLSLWKVSHVKFSRREWNWGIDDQPFL